MRIIRAEHMGICFGVRDAIELARTEAKWGRVTVLGELVHNERVVSELAQLGVQFETGLDRVDSPTLLVTAHGVSERRRKEIEGTGRRILDATCPLVRFAHDSLVRLVAQGYFPVVIGQRGHVEVRGLSEDFPECEIVLSEGDVDRMTVRPRFGVIAQTTQPIQRVKSLLGYVQRRFPNSEVRFCDTVCQPTKLRQKAAEQLADVTDVVIVVGGERSNNTRQLSATCESRGVRVHQVASAADLHPEWFGLDDTVGITAGTSTPEAVILEVERAIVALFPDGEADTGMSAALEFSEAKA